MPKQNPKADAYKSARPESEGSRSVLVHNKRATSGPDLIDCDASILRTFLASVLRNGDCVAITYTSDGGAISFTVLAGGTRYKSYLVHPDELRLVLDNLWDACYGSKGRD
jgi:hypothetical protein